MFHWNKYNGIIVLTSCVPNVKASFVFCPFIVRRGKSSQHMAVLMRTCARVVMSCKFESSNSFLKSYEYSFTNVRLTVKLCNSVCNILRIPKNATSNFLFM